MRRYAVSGYLIVLAMSLLALSCGTIRSVSAIRDADKARDEALRRIAVTFQDSRITVKDTYGRESLSKEAATFVEKKEDREPLYLFYVADGLLIKARDLQSKSEHERACELAEKSLEISGKSLNALKTVGAAGPAKEAAVPASGIAVPAPAPVAPAPAVAPKPAEPPKRAPALPLAEEKKEKKEKEEDKKKDEKKKEKKEENYYELYERLKKEAEEKNKDGSGGAQ